MAQRYDDDRRRDDGDRDMTGGGQGGRSYGSGRERFQDDDYGSSRHTGWREDADENYRDPSGRGWDRGGQQGWREGGNRGDWGWNEREPGRGTGDRQGYGRNPGYGPGNMPQRGYGQGGSDPYQQGGFGQPGYGQSNYGEGGTGQGVRGLPYGANAGGSYGAAHGGRGQSVASADDQTGGQHTDPHYRHWRDRMMKGHDDEFAAFNEERQKKFDTEFDEWRSNRASAGQRSDSVPGSARGTSSGDANRQTDANKKT